MICSTSFFNRAALLFAFLLTVSLWGCARSQTELIVFVPQPGVTEQDGESVEAKTAPSLHRGMLITVLPVENLSSTNAPLGDIENSISLELAKNGFRVANKKAFEQFRKKHRMRYTGGVSSALSEALLKELGADAVLITSLEAYREAEPPQISLIARLVSCGPQPEIIWIDSIGLSGDESPGLLDLNLIRSPQELLRKAVGILTESLTAHFDQETQGGETPFPSIPESWKATGPGTLTSPGYRLNRKYLPYDYFRSPIIDPGRKYSIAVLPMLDLAVRRNAGIIAQLHYVRELFNLTDFKVLEPGLVREGLLSIRALMPQGPSLAETDLITGKQLLGVDLVLSGKVFDYQNTSNNPKVDISVQIIEKNSRQVVFGARIFNTGLDRVFFYNFGREYTAHNLLKEMSKITVQLLTAPYSIEEQGEEEIIAHHPPLKRDEIKNNSDS